MNTTADGDLHPLVSKVVSEVRSLVDGNGASAADVTVRSGACHRRQVAMALDSAVGWATEFASSPGARDPGGSTRTAGRAAAVTEARSRCDAVIADPATWEGLARYLEGRPYELFRTLEPGFRWGAVPQRWHFFEACSHCGGSGRRRCGACDSGWVTCSSCGGSAQGRCSSCSGAGKVNGGYAKDSFGNLFMQVVTCPFCHGGGKGPYGSCGAYCSGGKVRCSSCGGTGSVQCGTCGATGSLTHAIQAHLTGTASRKMSHAADGPEAFRAAIDGLGILAVAGMAERRVSVGRWRGGASIHVACTLPHVRAEMSCRGVGIALDAIGEDALVPSMPAFLDALVKPTADAILHPSHGAEAVIRAARGSRLTEDLLQELGARRSGKAEDFVARWKGAVSVDLVRRLRDRLLRTYDAVGRNAVRAAWLGALFPLLAWSLLMELYAPAVIPPLVAKRTEAFQPVESALWDATFLLAPLAIVWLIAGGKGRGHARALMGAVAKRRPGQGWWPVIVAACIVVPHVALIAADVSGDTLGLPYEREFAALPVLRGWEESRRRSVGQQPTVIPPARAAPHLRHAAGRK